MFSCQAKSLNLLLIFFTNRTEKQIETNKSNEELPLPSPPIFESSESSESLSDMVAPFGLPSLPEPTERPPPPPTVLKDEPIYEAIQPRNQLHHSVEVLALTVEYII